MEWEELLILLAVTSLVGGAYLGGYVKGLGKLPGLIECRLWDGSGEVPEKCSRALGRSAGDGGSFIVDYERGRE
jgi:hypothetical protein